MLTWIKNLFGGKEKRGVPLRGADIISFGGTPSEAGVTVNEQTALQLTATSACVRAIAETFGSLPLHVYRRTKNGRERATEHPIYRLIHDQPNERMSSAVYRECASAQLSTAGNHYSYIAKQGARAYELRPLNPRTTKAVLKDGRYFFETFANGQRVELDPSEVLHIPGFTLDGLNGLDPISYCARSFGIALAQEKFASRYFGNSTHLGLYAKTPTQLSDKARENLRKSMASRSGVDDAFRFDIWEEGLEPGVLTINAEQAQFLESRKYSAHEIACRIFRVPPFMIGEESTGLSLEQQSLQFVRDVIRPLVVKWEQEINRKLFWAEEQDYYCEFNVDAFVRADIKTRYEAYAIAKQNGWLNTNEIRSKENEPGIGDPGDIYLTPLNMVSVDQLKDAPPPQDNTPKNNPNSVRRSIRPIVEDAARRVLTKEINALDRAVKKHLVDATDLDGFRSWATDFYASHEKIIRQSYTPFAETLEIGDDQLNTIIADHIERSQKDLALAMWSDDPYAAVIEVAARWEDTRPQLLATIMEQYARDT